MKLPARYLILGMAGTREKFSLVGCSDFPVRDYGTRMFLIVWDNELLKWFEFKKVRNGRALTPKKNARVTFREVPWGNDDAAGPERFAASIGDGHTLTPDQMAGRFEKSGDDFTTFDRGQHRERVRDAMILGLEIPQEVRDCFKDLTPSR